MDKGDVLMILWRDEMCIGVTAIDDDHKELFNIINEFDTCTTRKSAEATAKKLFGYTQSHFKREEDLQSEYMYPLRNQQKEQHAKIINDLKVLIRDAFINTNQTDAEVIASLSNLMRDWIVDHVIQSDMKMRTFFKSSNID